jgi:hypothetical protein
MSSRSIAAAVVPLLMSLAVHAEPTRSDPDRYGHMHMMLEKTWFKVDAAKVDVWFGPETRDLLQQIAAGQRYSDERAEQIARTVMKSPDVTVQIEMVRNASLGEFLDAAKGNLEHARDAGYITADNFTVAWQSVQKDFAPLAKRGLKKGDRLVYRARDDKLQTTITADDKVLLDLSSDDPHARTSMLASYFAPKTDFRDKLIKSLFSA